MAKEATASSLAQALRSERSAIIAECVAETVADADTLRRFARALPPSLGGVVVASDGVSALASAALLAAAGVEPILTLSTGDRNRDALLADARGGALLGVRSVLCLDGAASTEAAASFDIDPTQLVHLLSGGDASLSALLAGAEVFPLVRPLPLALIDTRKKVAAGAGFLVTQPIFDVAAFEQWMMAVRDEGISARVPILVGVQALTSVDEASATRRRLHIPDEVIARLQSAADAASEGIALCAELAARLTTVEGVRGLFIRSSGGPERLAEILRRADLRAA
jgi:5,10-methylenetetrahydrofolate reductase